MNVRNMSKILGQFAMVGQLGLSLLMAKVYHTTAAHVWYNQSEDIVILGGKLL